MATVGDSVLNTHHDDGLLKNLEWEIFKPLAGAATAARVKQASAPVFDGIDPTSVDSIISIGEVTASPPLSPTFGTDNLDGAGLLSSTSYNTACKLLRGVFATQGEAISMGKCERLQAIGVAILYLIVLPLFLAKIVVKIPFCLALALFIRCCKCSVFYPLSTKGLKRDGIMFLVMFKIILSSCSSFLTGSKYTKSHRVRHLPQIFMGAYHGGNENLDRLVSQVSHW